MPDLPVGESDPLAPLRPYLQHKPDCVRWAYGDLPCSCGRDNAAAEVRASVPTLSAEDMEICITGITMWEAEFGLSSDDWSKEHAVQDKLRAILFARFPDLGDQDG